MTRDSSVATRTRWDGGGQAVQPRARTYSAAGAAAAVDITVRTLRYYRQLGLVPSPSRQGRVAWYSDEHVARLRVICTLRRSGHALRGIADVIALLAQDAELASLLTLASGKPQARSGQSRRADAVVAVQAGPLATDGTPVRGSPTAATRALHYSSRTVNGEVRSI
ncbi:MerR family transcriptional regulator [Streptomyces sp. NPDC053474]|uniref:helix-turn-helix domain-containing protein n=1 Tax=Streptomyces sp. NPDC053474 TaxID=3365704 RepID=UPI0037D23B33